MEQSTIKITKNSGNALSLSKGVYIAILAALFLTATGCDDFVQVPPPSGQLITATVFEDRTTANAAMLSIYSGLRDSGMLTGDDASITVKMGAYADEFSFYGTSTNTTVNFYNNTLLASNAQITGWWQSAYRQIYAANALIEGVENSSALSQEDKMQLTGEACFVRALLHFNLTNLYGDVPYITTTDYRANSIVTRTGRQEVYSKVIEDLMRAVQSLPLDYIATERIRPNRAAATALLARVQLYSGNWQGAAENATVVLSDNNYSIPTDINATFLNTSSSTIWQYKPSLEGSNSAEGGVYILITTPPNNITLNPALVDAFEPGDLRRQNWVGSLSDGATNYYFISKYKEKFMTPTSLEYSIQLRLSEQYLIRAEAYARLGNLSSAAEDLNIIRNAAGLASIVASSQEQMLEAIIRERRVELFGEAAHRFFDLKRTGLLDVTLSPVKNGWDHNDQHLPLPESELMLNQNLAPQNPGY